jgi:hypothetical protein
VTAGSFATDAYRRERALDLVDLRTWTELQAAQNDVCLQTSEYHGSALEKPSSQVSVQVHLLGRAADS